MIQRIFPREKTIVWHSQRLCWQPCRRSQRPQRLQHLKWHNPHSDGSSPREEEGVLRLGQSVTRYRSTGGWRSVFYNSGLCNYTPINRLDDCESFQSRPIKRMISLFLSICHRICLLRKSTLSHIRKSHKSCARLATPEVRPEGRRLPAQVRPR